MLSYLQPFVDFGFRIVTNSLYNILLLLTFLITTYYIG